MALVLWRHPAQLGLINEALLGWYGRGTVTPEQATLALDRLEEIRLKIESLKTQRNASTVDSLSAQLEALRLSQPAAYAQLAQKFQLNAP